MANFTPIIRPNWYDFQKVSLQDMNSEQDFHLNNTGALADASIGSGVLLERPQEKVVFDSNTLNSFQQGLVAINAFDGRGIFETPYVCSDSVDGNQLWIDVTNSNLGGFKNLTVIVIGKTFENVLIYETLQFNNNRGELTKNHFIQVTNLMFNNFLGNLNTSVDGYGSMHLGGRVLITEAGSYKVGRDPVGAEQVSEPDIVLRDFKTWSSGITLQNAIIEAIGTSNNIDDLNINTTTAKTRLFSEGASTTTIYGQKFQLSGNNIQKVTLLLGLTTGTTWTGSLTVGIRQLQTSATSTSSFLPDNAIDFDPSTETLEEVTISQSDLNDRGITLGAKTQPVEFFFNSSPVANPNISNLNDGQFYCITIRRTGSTATGTLFMEEARNSDITRKLTVFDGTSWTDVSSSSLWFIVSKDAARVASGVAYDNGIRLVIPKITINDVGANIQEDASNVVFADTSEEAENYIIAKRADRFTDAEKHPRTGDSVFASKYDGADLEAMSQSSVQDLINNNNHTVILARSRDLNPKSNPVITGQLTHPGLGLHNQIHIINPSSDLLTHNTVGSIITPNILKPSLRYRIIKQETITDLYGDVDGDGKISDADLTRQAALDGYATNLNSGSVAAATQIAAVLNNFTSVAEILRADVDGTGVVGPGDVGALNAFLNSGTAFSVGSSFTRIVLTLESIFNPQFNTNHSGNSTLEIQNADSSLVNNTSFATINFSIEFLSTWKPDNIDLLDLRRFTNTTFIDLTANDLTAVPESGGKNSFFTAGDMYLAGVVKKLDGNTHPLDYEENTIELELPEGTTAGTIDIFNIYVVDKMKFSSGTLVAATAINDSQIKFAVSLSSYSKQLDGYDFTHPSDGYGTENVDEVIGTYMDHDAGLLRIFAKNISYNPVLPQIRTRITVVVKLKEAGFTNESVFVNKDTLAELIT